VTKRQLEAAVVAEAIIAWRGHRPVGWTVDQHVENPTINCTRDSEKGLAVAVANYMKHLKTLRKTGKRT
jgi:hypothetical protein